MSQNDAPRWHIWKVPQKQYRIRWGFHGRFLVRTSVWDDNKFFIQLQGHWVFPSDGNLGHISSYHLACEMLPFHVYFWYNFFFRPPYSPPTQFNAFFLIEFQPFWKFWVNLGFWLLPNLPIFSLGTSIKVKLVSLV